MTVISAGVKFQQVPGGLQLAVTHVTFAWRQVQGLRNVASQDLEKFPVPTLGGILHNSQDHLGSLHLTWAAVSFAVLAPVGHLP